MASVKLDIDGLRAMRKKVRELEDEIVRKKTSQEGALKRLAKEHGVQTVKQAEKKLGKMEKELDRKKKELTNTVEELDAIWAEIK